MFNEERPGVKLNYEDMYLIMGGLDQQLQKECTQCQRDHLNELLRKLFAETWESSTPGMETWTLQIQRPLSGQPTICRTSTNTAPGYVTTSNTTKSATK